MRPKRKPQTMEYDAWTYLAAGMPAPRLRHANRCRAWRFLRRTFTLR